MKKITLSILSILAVMLLLAGTTAPVQAAKPVAFNAAGTILSIDEGTVKPAGDSGRFVVQERTINGAFFGPDLAGPFTFDYKANVELLTQAGNLNGAMQSGPNTMNVNGTSAPLAFFRFITILGPTGDPMTVPEYKLDISGVWNFTSGAQGAGTFTASLVFVPTPDGHIAFVDPYASSFVLTGQWQP